MKKLLCILLFLCVSLGLFAQVQITTKKEKLSDFTTKVTKIVLSGDAFLDPFFKEAVKNTWTISPFEFCTRDEFEELSSSSDYYFLFIAVDMRKESSLGVESLKLIKGGSDSLDKALQVASFPLRPEGEAGGREITFLPAILGILQAGAEQTVGNGMKPPGSIKLRKGTNAAIYIATEDLSESGKEAAAKVGGISLVSADDAEELFDSGEDVLVSYVVAPDDPSPGQACHVMLIDARTHKLRYLRSRRISSGSGPGFEASDINSISDSLK